LVFLGLESGDLDSLLGGSGCWRSDLERESFLGLGRGDLESLREMVCCSDLEVSFGLVELSFLGLRWGDSLRYSTPFQNIPIPTHYSSNHLMTLTELTDQREFDSYSSATDNKNKNNNNLEPKLKSKNSSQPNSAGPKREKSRSFLSRFTRKKSQGTTKSHSPKEKKED